MKLSQLALSYGFAGRLMLGIIWCFAAPARIRRKHTARRDRNDAPSLAAAAVPRSPAPAPPWQARGQRSIQRPAHHLARESIQDHRQVNELCLQPNVSDVGHPELIDAGQLHPAGEIQIDLQLMLGIRGDHEGPRLHRQQVVFPHQPRHAFVVHQHPAPTQFCGHPAIAVAAPMLQHDLLDRRPHFHLFFHRLPLLQRPVEARPAHLGQLTHPLDTQAALHRHHFPDLVVDAVAPESLLLWRRASTFCKAPLKKSSFQRLVCQHPLELADLFAQRELHAISVVAATRHLHRLQLIAPLVQQPPMIPKFLRQRHDVVALLQPLHRHLPERHSDTAPLVFFATRSSFLCKVCQLRVSQSRGSVQEAKNGQLVIDSLAARNCLILFWCRGRESNPHVLSDNGF